MSGSWLPHAVLSSVLDVAALAIEVELLGWVDAANAMARSHPVEALTVASGMAQGVCGSGLVRLRTWWYGTVRRQQLCGLGVRPWW